jgi:hypothetical protein
MNIEQTKEAIKVMQSWVDGKELEVREVDEWRRTFTPLWQWYTNDYRIKPTVTLRPWISDEVPLGAQVRKKSDPTYRWVIANTGSHDDRLKLVENHEHSTDGGKTWLPCGVMEESK